MADKNYLDKSGLNFFWGKVKDWIATKKFLSYSSQGLTDEERAQARANIGAGTYSKPSDGIPASDIASGVIPLGGVNTPLMNGTAAVGTATKWAHEDHVHPIDTTRAPLSSPSFTGSPKTVAITSASATNAIANKKYVDDLVASASYTLPVASSTVLGGVMVDGNILTIASGGTLGVNSATTASYGVVKLSDSISESASDKSTTAATPNAVINYVSTQVASLFSYGGSTSFSSLPTPDSSTVNKIYNVTDSFTTTSDFVEGAGNTYPAGTNIIGVDIGTSSSHNYKYDVTTGFLDLSDFPNTPITNAEISAIVV